jgi:mannitol/fructose-specific phosphotransferase system IIA component (Ntr-type)
MIEKSIILDLDRHMTLEEFVTLAAEKLSVRLNMDSSVLVDLLLAREKESSTVLNPILAIPHVVIEGEKSFYILIARSREGVAFSEQAQQVHSIFILLGTRDLRNLHLRTLSAIAQVAMGKQFERRWLAARDAEAIRNMILLSARTRI